MKVLWLLFCVSVNFVNVSPALTSEEAYEVQKTCCSHGDDIASTLPSISSCRTLPLPEDIEPEQVDTCRTAALSCCELVFRKKDDCDAGIKKAPSKRCIIPKTEIGKMCCEECSFGQWIGESQGEKACGSAAGDNISQESRLRQNAFFQCCLKATLKPETTTEKRTTTVRTTTITPKPTTVRTTTTTPKPTTVRTTTTTPKPTTSTTTTTPKQTTVRTTTTPKPTKVEPTTVMPKPKCKKDSCEHECDDSDGIIRCSCREGFILQDDKKSCKDIDECAQNVSNCGPEQRCENFYGGYSCQCPTGHRLVGQNDCEDIDECVHGNSCAYNDQCINTVGSYRCKCADGFRNAASNDTVCVDVDECEETPSVCEQGCANAWGGYRCYCSKGYRLYKDNRTCVDVNECEEWLSVQISGKMCGGQCVNEPGSYRCSCPRGYRLSEDQKTCIDIDECENGEATCAHAVDPGYVCQNTKGSYHCHHIKCPQGYKLESRHRCARIQRSCFITDWACLQRPSSYRYTFITIVSNIYRPSGSIDLFKMDGLARNDSVVSFEMKMKNVQASSDVHQADLRCFELRINNNECVISLLCSLEGPQVAELELTMTLYQRGMFAGSTVARLIVIVSEYDF